MVRMTWYWRISSMVVDLSLDYLHVNRRGKDGSALYRSPSWIIPGSTRCQIEHTAQRHIISKGKRFLITYHILVRWPFGQAESVWAQDFCQMLWVISIGYISSQSLLSEHELYYCLSLDEVHIRKQIIFSEGEMKWYIDYGDFEILKPSEKEAKTRCLLWPQK